jgi:hypothetical protein
MSNDTSRRRFLAVAGSTTIAALAGCSGGEGGTETDAMGGEPTESMGDGTTGTESMDDETTESMDGEATESMDEGMESVTVTVRMENVAPMDVYGAETPTGGAVWLTPGAFAVHTGENPIFTPGERASVGLEALAEAGPPTGFEGETGLVGELRERTGSMGVVAAGAYTPERTVADPNDPTGEVPGASPIAPGGAFEFDVEARPGHRLSLASMFVPSNDVFVAPGASGITLWPADGDPVEGDVTAGVDLWDAGTEPNQPPGRGADQAPAQERPDQGDDEDEVVRRLDDVDDGHEYPAASDVVRVTLTPHGTMDDGM